MRNRAECLDCGDIIESISEQEGSTHCSCRGIWIWGGPDNFHSAALDYSKFMRIDEKGKQIPVTYIDKEPSDSQVNEKAEEEPQSSLTKWDKVLELERFFDHENFDRLPSHQQYSFVTQAQFQSLGLLLLSIIKED